MVLDDLERGRRGGGEGFNYQYIKYIHTIFLVNWGSLPFNFKFKKNINLSNSGSGWQYVTVYFKFETMAFAAKYGLLTFYVFELACGQHASKEKKNNYFSIFSLV